MRIEFVPDDRCLASINKQIRATHLAYPLFGLARMFLQEPERHCVQVTVSPEAPAGTMLYQLGDDGPVTTDRAILEKTAFETEKDKFYAEESIQKEPLKGNFTNVARERLSGTLLGPTNYHAYQPALRSLYESRYSRRMSFEDFRRNVEVSTDPALIERWKEEARTTTTISTRVAEGEAPVTLNSPADARAHFRQHHLDALVRSGTTFTVHGSIARKLPEPGVMAVIRESHVREMRYPAQFVQLLRQGLQNCGLHIFKHRKRVVYVSLARPTPFVARGAVSPNVTAILETIAESPLCTRKVLAEHVLAKHTSAPETSPVDAETGAAETAAPTAEAASQAQPTSAEPLAAQSDETPAAEPDEMAAEIKPDESPVVAQTEAAPTAAPEDSVTKARAALAADLRFLVQSGHIIEFHNGTFDLPLPPKAKETPAAPAKPGSPATSKLAAEANRPAQSVVSEASAQEPTSAFTATGAGVAEAQSEAEPTADEPVPSLLEEKEPAPTPATLAEAPESSDDDEDATPEIVITPGVTDSTQQTDALHDKVDDNGRVSGAGAMLLDPPVFGDTEDPPASQP